MIDLETVLRAIPGLPRPVALLEGGAGGGGSVRIAWGAQTRRRVDFSPEIAGDWDQIGWIDDGASRYGYLAYDLGLPPRAVRRPAGHELPLAEFFVPEYEMVLNARDGSVLGSTPGAADVLIAAARASGADGERNPPVPRLRSMSFDRQGFEEVVRRTKEYIAEGDVYQANLSVEQVFSFDGDPWSVYLRLRNLNPSPWMGYADFGDWQIVSGSPELLVEVTGEGDARVARTRPIAGTRKKTGEFAEDDRMRRELELDEKERAEHLMLVDLARNDVGRFVEFGSLEVSDLAVMEEYSHVFHLVSEVRGRIRPERTTIDVLRAIFPCGTITGVPKIRAMEVIAELEPVARLGYTGGLGWVKGDELQFNILIRSAFIKDSLASVRAGAGIVWDSIPEREWFESLRKAEAVRIALGVKS